LILSVSFDRNQSDYSMESDIAAIKVLVQSGANVHSQKYTHLQKEDGRTLLTRLLLGKKSLFQDALRYLIDTGVDPELPDTTGCSFMDYVDSACKMPRSNSEQRRLQFWNFIQDNYPTLFIYPEFRAINIILRNYGTVVYISW